MIVPDFKAQYPIRSDFWCEVEDLSLLSAALLTLGIDPSALDAESEACGEHISLSELPSNFLQRIETLRSAVRAGSLVPLALGYDRHERLDENQTRIKTVDFVNWCNSKGIPHNLPDYDSPRHADKWPWGNHETELLSHLADVGVKFWKNFDPSDPTTAARNEDVVTWLKERGVAERNAEVMATMLRANNLRPGPRK